ncbi:MAG TPA: c-type cytochrome [Vicinamibacterales bacterium]|nr:c-type cytochrome [Vicinamibacterales bacterium]
MLRRHSSTTAVFAAGLCAVWLSASGLPLRAGQAPSTAQDHPGQYGAAEIEAGSRLYNAQCALCHGPNGDVVGGVNLRRGQFKRAVSDDDLRRVIGLGIPAAGMPGTPLQPAELDAVVAFIRAGFDVSGVAVRIGDAARGRAVFQSAKAACSTCHRVNGEGPRTAPDLSDIGSIRQPAALQRILLDPTASMWPINRPVVAVTRDGTTIRGRRLNEDTFTVQLIDERERLVSLVKADLKSYELGKTSPMPSVAGKLSSDELADLIAYLISLKGL